MKDEDLSLDQRRTVDETVGLIERRAEGLIGKAVSQPQSESRFPTEPGPAELALRIAVELKKRMADMQDGYAVTALERGVSAEDVAETIGCSVAELRQRVGSSGSVQALLQPAP